MLIRDILKGKKFLLSFEVFPPKKESDVENLYETIVELKELTPDFVSVTYGAGGSTRDKTVEIASHIKNNIGIEAMAHLTCVNSTKEDIKNVLKQLSDKNIENILALRGDPPAGEENFTKTIGGFGYASELVEFIKNNGDWSIGVAGYPEGHIQTPNLKEDIKNLKKKIDNGGDFILTQLYFDNKDFLEFRDLAHKNGINVPIIPRIFPILNYKAIKKISVLCGAKIPQDLLDRLDKNQENADAIENIGIEYAIKQSIELLKYDIPGIHFYTMNKSKQIKQIYNEIKNQIMR